MRIKLILIETRKNEVKKQGNWSRVAGRVTLITTNDPTVLHPELEKTRGRCEQTSSGENMGCGIY